MCTRKPCVKTVPEKTNLEVPELQQSSGGTPRSTFLLEKQTVFGKNAHSGARPECFPSSTGDGDDRTKHREGCHFLDPEFASILIYIDRAGPKCDAATTDSPAQCIKSNECYDLGQYHGKNRITEVSWNITKSHHPKHLRWKIPSPRLSGTTSISMQSQTTSRLRPRCKEQPFEPVWVL